MSNSSSIKAQGFVIRRGISDNIFIILPDNDTYPEIEGYFNPDGFPGGFDTSISTNIISSLGVSSLTEVPSASINTDYQLLSTYSVNNDTIYDNTNYLETYAPSGGI